MSNEWITHRPPTIEDCAGVDRVPHSDHVWVMHEGKVTTCPFGHIVVGCPWRPIVVQRPEPYVKPKLLTDEELDKATAQERDALLDHIYEYGTMAEGLLERVRKLCRAAIAKAKGEQP